ncbi:uncharacterized protein LOC132958325 [Labrus mixtus]|uniref:uncharacterized protein LOC132958325 n=1 Tax=Labrus mixtus TaxID=508554 RepID=UPI0029BFD9D5|nr:uncharacterized protein LOC132958325 [Labrus mixtus]
MSNPSYNPYAPGNPNSTQGQREHNMQTIPELGDYDLRASDKPAATSEHRKPKFTPETAAKILLHFGLEKEDLEFLISYPEDQMTPANLPLILHQIHLQKDRDNSGGSGYVSTMDTTDNRNGQEPFQKKDTEQESSFTSLGSSCSSALSSASPSSDKTTQSQMLPKQTFQDTLSSFPLQKVDTDMRFYKSEAPKPVPLNPQEVDCQSILKTQLPSTLSHGIHPSRPGLVLIGSNDWTFQDTLSSSLPKKDTDMRFYKSEAPKPVPLNPQEVDCQSILKTQLPSTLSHGIHPSRPGLVLIGSNDQAFQDTFSSFPLPKKDTDIKVYKSEAPKPVPLNQQEVDCQSTLKTQLPSTLSHGIHPSRPGLVLIGSNDRTFQDTLSSFPLPKKDTDIKVYKSEAPKPVPLNQQEVDCPSTLKTQLPSTLSHGLHPSQPGLVLSGSNDASDPKEVKDEVAVSKDQPSPEMLYDYALAIPKIFPHTCSLCNKDCTDLNVSRKVVLFALLFGNI